MCGIGILLYGQGPISLSNMSELSIDPKRTFPELNSEKKKTYETYLINALKRRGPDYFSSLQMTIASTSLSILSSTLHMRGKEITKQPLRDDQGNFLCWNGEIYHPPLSPHINDGQYVFRHLVATSPPPLPMFFENQIEGPFSFVFWHNESNTLYFGRDFLGRRSLIVQPFSNGIILSSVGLSDENLPNYEVPADKGIFKLSFGKPRTISLELLPWASPLSSRQRKLSEPVTRGYRSRQDLIEAFINTLQSAIEKRLSPLPSLRCHSLSQPNEKHCKKKMKCTSLPRIGVLFSGGVDSSLIARLASKALPPKEPIELINIAFLEKTGVIPGEQVPDRISSRLVLDELRQCCPEREWIYIEITIEPTELYEKLPHIISLCRPQHSVMDISIGSALWFAARGRGKRLNNDFSIHSDYCAQCTILLLGQGADEQCGGYGRHRTALQRGGATELQAELEKDILRMWERNLGRDDRYDTIINNHPKLPFYNIACRVISDHGKEARYPFLDEKFVTFVNNLFLKEITLELEDSETLGHIDKQIIRQCAHHLGLFSASTQPKRAIQFGSRIAKIFKEKARISCSSQRKMGHQPFQI